ncbi:oncostatin-M-mediated signaling pathway [Pristimantis euphronides]
MDRYSGQRRVIVAVILMLNLRLWPCQQAEVSFPPVKLEIRNDSLQQRLLVDWSVSNETYKSDTDIMFHIQVARSKEMSIVADEYVRCNFSRSRTTFSWVWDSQLPLECDSHSVRIRSAVLEKDPPAQSDWSQWSEWKTHQGQNIGRKVAGVYPKEPKLLVGSDVTFCCLPAQNQMVKEMIYNHQKLERVHDMRTEAFVISLKNLTHSKSAGDSIHCILDKNPTRFPIGTLLLVSRKPDEPKHFSCETQDMQSLRCSWDPGNMKNLIGNFTVRYFLDEWFSQKCQPCEKKQCTWPLQMNQQTYIFTLTASNIMGNSSINSPVYLKERVRLLAPSSLRESDVSASTITLMWSLGANYTSFKIHCQADLQEPGIEVNITSRGKGTKYTYSVRFNGLQPYTQYNSRVRCIADSSLAGWSNWSHLVVRTGEAAPTGTLDVWRRLEDDGDGRNVTLYWKPSSLFRENGELSHYRITFWPLEGASEVKEVKVLAVNSCGIRIGGQAYVVHITAHNRAGESPPAELRIPVKNTRVTEQIITKRTDRTDGGLYITWQQKPNVLGYVVEWWAAPKSDIDLQWKKYNSTIQSDIIRSATFRPGQRYDFRIYGSMKDGEHLLEKVAGYTEELVCSVKPNVTISQTKSSLALVDWSPYPTDKCLQGFVTEYYVYVKYIEANCTLNEADDYILQDNFIACKFCIRDPDTTQFMIQELKPDGNYAVAVVAVTKGGETPKDYKPFHTLFDARTVLLPTLVPIITVSVLALLLLFVGCWQRAWLKRKCIPDIPDPNKSKMFPIIGTKGSFNGILLPIANCEPDVVSVQENRPHGTCEEMNDPSRYELNLIYTEIQTREGSQCETVLCEDYVPYDNEEALYPAVDDPASQPQQHPYRELYNQSYNKSLDDRSNNTSVYKPQNNNAHCLAYSGQSVDPDSAFGDTAISFHSSGYSDEPTSPTSVGSTTFMLEA